MAESRAASQYFEQLPEYSLAIWREYTHGVLPSSIAGMLADDQAIANASFLRARC
jgi:hypothetical protein